MRIPLFQVDAFADRPFGGNPAAVCLLAEPANAIWMQQVAQEMNLSETAFLHRVEGGWRLRWFTPKVEVQLCGHATLASAHVLWETGQLAPDRPARFETLSGLLTATRVGSDITMDFPAKPATPVVPVDGLAEVLGVAPVRVGRSAFDYLIEAAGPDIVRGLRPDFQRLAKLPVRGVIVTSRADQPGYDFISRFFAPASGVDEDPVTGSAHCTLGPFWQERLGRGDFTAWQASARGGRVRVQVRGDRVLLGGKAVTVLRGELVAGH